ncbi:hypothetical protein O6H91_15G026200 [Diphasiastrum complanatum]|uniref:Uncharacterized protein n=1 Tax=Diphasiastrum complanatum TaxID=34168 RepID=A0ACC2BGQ7_DIPCM|nr:hypothetical protein O6H91_15G026200 [Diphasiastrum complanatum]
MASLLRHQVTKKFEDSKHPRIRFLCSYGGTILPRPCDAQLRYVGGDTRILVVRKNIAYTELIDKLAKLVGRAVCFLYQLPHEDLDALISVVSDEDLANMIEEYEKWEARELSCRLRLFLLPAKQPNGPDLYELLGGFCKPEKQFVGAVNGSVSTRGETDVPAQPRPPASDRLMGREDPGIAPKPSANYQCSVLAGPFPVAEQVVLSPASHQHTLPFPSPSLSLDAPFINPTARSYGPMSEVLQADILTRKVECPSSSEKRKTRGFRVRSSSFHSDKQFQFYPVVAFPVSQIESRDHRHSLNKTSLLPVDSGPDTTRQYQSSKEAYSIGNGCYEAGLGSTYVGRQVEVNIHRHAHVQPLKLKEQAPQTWSSGRSVKAAHHETYNPPRAREVVTDREHDAIRYVLDYQYEGCPSRDMIVQGLDVEKEPSWHPEHRKISANVHKTSIPYVDYVKQLREGNTSTTRMPQNVHCAYDKKQPRNSTFLAASEQIHKMKESPKHFQQQVEPDTATRNIHHRPQQQNSGRTFFKRINRYETPYWQPQHGKEHETESTMPVHITPHPQFTKKTPYTATGTSTIRIPSEQIPSQAAAAEMLAQNQEHALPTNHHHRQICVGNNDLQPRSCCCGDHTPCHFPILQDKSSQTDDGLLGCDRNQVATSGRQNFRYSQHIVNNQHLLPYAEMLLGYR